MESWLFLALVLAIAVVGKNMSLVIASVVVMALKLLPVASKWLPVIQNKGINWGVTVISVAILVPIATGQITFADLFKAFKNPAGWIAIVAGIAVAILSKYGVNQLAAVPQVTVALVLGTIIGVVVFKGVAAGPVIASGMTYCIVTLLNLHFWQNKGLWHNLYSLAKVRTAQYTNGLQCPAKPNTGGLFVLAGVRRRTSKLVLSHSLIFVSFIVRCSIRGEIRPRNSLRIADGGPRSVARWVFVTCRLT